MTQARRSAITLIEVLLAASILALASVSIMDAFLMTQRQATTSEAQMSSGVMAQIIVERIRACASMNPRYFRDLMGSAPSWTFTGTLVDPASAVNTELALSPYFEYLFTRADPALCTEANRVSIAKAAAATPTGLKPADLSAMIEGFRDFQATVTIEHDADLESSGAQTPFAEIGKRVTVTIARTSVIRAQGADPLAFTLVSRIPTPSESLSDAAIDLLASRFDGPTLEEQWYDLSVAMQSNPVFNDPQFSDVSRHLIADSALILRAANNESLIVEGRCIPGSIILDEVPGAAYIDPWIATLSDPAKYAISSSKRELAQFHTRKAGVIFDAFKRMRHPLEHFTNEVLGPAAGTSLLERVRVLEGYLAAAISAYAIADQAALDAAVAQINARIQDVTLSAFLQQFFVDTSYAPIATRPARYPQRFRGTLDDAATVLVAHLDQSSGVTPFEAMGASQLYREVTCVRQIDRGAADGQARARLKQLANRNASSMAELARYLSAGEAHDLDRLKVRNARFVDRHAQMLRLATRYQQVIDLFLPGGEIARFLNAYTVFFGPGEKKDAESLLGSLPAAAGGGGGRGP